MTNLKISLGRFLQIVVAMFMLGTITFAQVSVTFPTVGGTAGTEKLAPVTVGSLTGQNVTAFSFTINYDKTKIELLGVDVVGTLTAGNAPTVNADVTNGKLVVAWASATPLSAPSGGTLLNLKVKFIAAGVQALNSADFLFNAGTPAAAITAGSATTASLLVQGGAVAATAGDVIKIPVLVTEITTAMNVTAYNFTATFNKDVINITGYELENTLSAGGSASINPNNTTGTVAFAWARGSNITGGGTLVYITGTAVAKGTTVFDFTSFQFNAGTPTSVAEDGTIAVAELNVAPTLALTPNQTTFSVNEATALAITLVGADANVGQTLTYSMTATPAITGATLNAATGAFAWTPSYTQAGTYSVTFKVTDPAGLFATKVVSVVVTNVNRAPSFTTVLPAGRIVPVHNVPVGWSFFYTATDPDGDPLIFSLEAGPNGSSITANGIFTWIPTVDQLGKSYLVHVKVSDGTLFVTHSQTITAASTLTGVEELGIPTEFVLLQNYPNPFNPTTSIQFGLPSESYVRLTVFNILGQEVALLVNASMGAGYHKVNFDASKLNTGMYIYKIEANNFVSVRKMLLVK
jgi:hypothetical protein